MSDIVIRLRDEASDLHNNGVMSLMDEAADEIERLRADLELRTAEVQSCKAAIAGEMESADESKAELAVCRRLLREACDHWTEACVVASEDGKYSKEYGVCIVGSEWYEQAKAAGGGE